jgi:hypothetical protein
MVSTASLRTRLRTAAPATPQAPIAPGWVWGLAGAGYVQAAGLLLAGFAAGVLPGARGLVGIDVVSTDLHRPVGLLLIGTGLVSLMACAFVVLGHGFALLALLGAGVLGTVLLATAGSWVVVVVPAAMALALLLALLTPALDHLHPRAGEG